MFTFDDIVCWLDLVSQEIGNFSLNTMEDIYVSEGGIWIL